jgi:predicted nucleic acid-binding protein
VAAATEAGNLYACVPFLLEAGYSARESHEHDALLGLLLSLPWAAIDESVEREAIDCQRQLARAGHHRMPPVDILIASIAHVHELGVLHYDRDFDHIRARTSLRFESVWLARSGSL